MRWPWEKFRDDKIKIIFSEKKRVVDIGGGLRISKNRGNRFDQSRAWIVPLAERVKYEIVDPVGTYNPDVLGDIHDLPFPDDSVESIICSSVLEHVEDPRKGIEEIYRVLEPGGYALLYVPFLYYYHAEAGYYKDYWRFSEDIIIDMSRQFSSVQICNVHGAIATWLKISPLSRYSWIISIADYLDIIFGKQKSKQTSGYSIFLVK